MSWPLCRGSRFCTCLTPPSQLSQRPRYGEQFHFNHSTPSPLYQQCSRRVPSTCFEPSSSCLQYRRRLTRMSKLVVGILGTTDQWLAQELFTLSFVSCGAQLPAVLFSSTRPDTVLKERGYLLGSNGPNRLILKFPPKADFRITSRPKANFLNYLRSLKSQPNSSTLVIILAGHGDIQEGDVIIDKDRLKKSEVEAAISHFAGKIFLISAACYSGHWISLKWMLLAAATPIEESLSFPQSDSGHFNGGLFGENVPSLSLQEAGIITPQPFQPDDPHSFQPGQTPGPISYLPTSQQKSIAEIIIKMDQRIATYPCSRTDFFSSSNTSWSVPLADISDDFLALIGIRHPKSLSSASSSLPALNNIQTTSSASNHPNLQRTHSRTTPQLAAVNDDIVDKFMSRTRRVLRSHASNVTLISFISESVNNMALRSVAEALLREREKKRDLARMFVTLMNWEPLVSDEDMGLGLTDAAMDYHDGQTRAFEFDQASGTNFQLLNAISPLLTMGNSSGRLWEPMSWAARHWDHAGRPKMEPAHILYVLKQAGLFDGEDTSMVFMETNVPFAMSEMHVVFAT
ncbi:hypothetical protein C8J56DRAFT_964867 [Mycena floridula]|nr:hypothetical protein C8J56DRAFT_964867 [Mycena floridula]